MRIVSPSTTRERRTSAEVPRMREVGEAGTAREVYGWEAQGTDGWGGKGGGLGRGVRSCYGNRG